MPFGAAESISFVEAVEKLFLKKQNRDEQKTALQNSPYSTISELGGIR